METVLFAVFFCCHFQPIEQELHFSGSTSRTMAAISLGFIVIVTPWTILEIVTACTGSKVNLWLILAIVLCFY